MSLTVKLWMSDTSLRICPLYLVIDKHFVCFLYWKSHKVAFSPFFPFSLSIILGAPCDWLDWLYVMAIITEIVAKRELNNNEEFRIIVYKASI